MKKLISIILSVVLLFSMLAVQASAALDPIYVKDADNNVTDIVDYKETLLQYLNKEHEFKSEEEKLANMTFKYEKDGYQLYVDEFTGEVATKNLATGQILFSNPYDIGADDAAHGTTKYELMSQIIVKYVDNGTEKLFNSFEQAAMNGQIDVKNIKNGLRVEYTIGREDTKYLAPRLIEKERFETNIKNVLLEAVMQKYKVDAETAKGKFEYKKLNAYYNILKDPNNVSSDRELAEMQQQYPITKKQYNGQLMAVYVCSAQTATELREIEDKIKTFCPKYTFEDLEYDHELTEYQKDERAPALFKMALEYRLDENGVTVRLPSNGIRFNEAEYQLSDISILPWMGCGSNKNTGYTFFPDGSGAIFRYEDLDNKRTHTITGSIYGQDYAYHTITGTHQEIIRYPVFGAVENKKYTVVNPETNEETVEIVDRGYVAIVEEGEALATLTLKHYGAQSKYNTVYMSVNPRPKDSYVLSSAVSVGSNNSVTVISERKYVGDYKIRYMMLTDKELAEEKQVSDYYEATWMGMARAYRDYLSSPYSTGTQNLPENQQYAAIDRLTAEEVKSDIPLYIETFGAVETIDKVLSIPVKTMAALTSFDDIKQMFIDLSGKNITNVNFKLNGYYNGGMYSSVPYRLNFEKAVGGKEGFESLIKDAKERGYGVYLDFDFVYASMVATKAFDGLSNSRDLVKTIDDRYTSRQYYSATTQGYTSYFELAISPSRYEFFYDKVSEKYLEYNPIGISLSTLASELNSDFDEDEPYNREDSKKFTMDMFEKISKDYSNVMSESANAYTWSYIDHMINTAVDSSRYTKASNSVPFLGVVLHGHVQFAGTPINMEGNIGHAVLKAIENGSGLYFVLSYKNTDILKDDPILSQNYSVRYDIWFDELVERYLDVNSVLKDLQTKLIIDHEFLVGERVPDPDEIIADKEAAEKLEQEKLEAEAEKARIEFINKLRIGRYDSYDAIVKAGETLASIFNSMNVEDLGDYDKFITEYGNALAAGLDVKHAEKKAALAAAERAYDEAVASGEATDDELVALSAAKTLAQSELRAVVGELKKLREAHTVMGKNITTFRNALKTFESSLADVKFAYDEITNGDYDADVVADITAKYAKAVAICEEWTAKLAEFEADYKAKYYEKLLALDMEDFYKPEAVKPETDNKNEGKTEETYNKYLNDNGNIVAVTYGGKGGNDNDPYRTFILNYNYFEVTVKYGETTHIIPAFSYVVINH